MAIKGDTGNGATLTLALFDSSGDAISEALEVITIDVGDITAEGIDVSTLGTEGYREHIPNDLATIAESSATFKWLTDADIPVIPSAAGTCTVTLPLRAGEATAANITGTGFLTRVKGPTLENGVMQEGEVAWQWDGDTGPTFTKAIPT